VGSQIETSAGVSAEEPRREAAREWAAKALQALDLFFVEL